MRVFINMLMFKQQLDGTGYYTLRILKQLQLLDKESEYILLFSRSIIEPHKVFKIYNVNFKIKQISIGFNVCTRIFIEQFFLPLIITKGILYSPSVSLPILPMYKVKKITTIHDLIPYYFPKKYSIIQRLYFKQISKYLSRFSDVVITVSQNTKKDIISFFNVPEHKVLVVHNFLETLNVEKYDCNCRKDYFITVSTIQPGKNLEGIIKSFSEFIRQNESQTKLLIIGANGWGATNIFEIVKNLKLEDRVVFLGYIAEEELIEHYRASSGLIYLSFYEGFGIPPLEALSYGCPVLVSNNSSLPEVAGKAAIYADPYDINSIVQGILLLCDKKVVAEKSYYFESEVLKFNPYKETEKLIRCFKSLNNND